MTGKWSLSPYGGRLGLTLAATMLLSSGSCSDTGGEKGEAQPSPPEETRQGASSPVERDVVIVGGGLAGLAAAAMLSDFDVLLLERENHLGGRVRTKRAEGVAYEMGALFSYNQDALPWDIPREKLIREDRPVGVSIGGKLHVGDNISELISSLEELPREERDAFEECQRREPFRPADLPSRIRSVVEGFFGVIHPGDPDEYLPVRRRDFSTAYPTHHFENGNAHLVDFLASRSGAEVLLSAPVTSVDDEGDSVRISYQRGSVQEDVVAAMVIVATTATVASAITKKQLEESRRFLSSVRYGHGHVIVLGIRSPLRPEVRYAVTPEQKMTSVFVSRTREEDLFVLTVYFTGQEAEEVRHLDPDEQRGMALTELRKAGLGSWGAGEIAFFEQRFWPELGTIISPETFQHFRPVFLRPSSKVLLAGDYTQVNGSDPMPYGIEPALASGFAAGREAAGLLERRRGTKQRLSGKTGAMAAGPLRPESVPGQGPFEPQKLTTCTLYGLAETGPTYLRQMEEGDLAYYGLLLQADQGGAAAGYLLSNAEDGLWGYQVGYGPTSADTALVLEGLLASGVPTQRLVGSAERLVQLFWDRDSGGFSTVVSPRADYWSGPSVETTAHVAWLLERIAPDRFEEVIRRATEYVAAHQGSDGLWSGKWFPSRTIPTFYAVRLLSGRTDADRDRLGTASRRLADVQRSSGSFEGSRIETAAGILALSAAGGDRSAIERGRAWLENSGQATAPGEPVLYYWMDDPREGRVFYSCRDHGAIADAWVRIALRETQPR